MDEQKFGRKITAWRGIHHMSIDMIELRTRGGPKVGGSGHGGDSIVNPWASRA